MGNAVETEEQLQEAVKKLLEAGGPAFIDVRIRKGIRPDIPPLKIIPSELKDLLMTNISKGK